MYILVQFFNFLGKDEVVILWKHGSWLESPGLSPEKWLCAGSRVATEMFPLQLKLERRHDHGLGIHEEQTSY